MPVTYGDAGTNRSITSVAYGDAGVNRTITEMWYGDAGTNRLVFAGVNLLGLNPYSAANQPDPSSATYALTSAGLETATGLPNNTWLLSGVAANYDVFATLNSGALTSGTTGVWLNLGATRSWNVSRGGGVVGTSTANLTMQIRLVATMTVIASANVVITAETI